MAKGEEELEMKLMGASRHMKRFERLVVTSL